MSDAARAKAREVRRNIEGLSMFDVEAERTIASALGEYAAEQTAALRDRVEVWQEVAEQDRRETAALREEIARLRGALQHVSVTSSRYRSHRGDCTATCTCDAVQDDKLVKHEIGRVVQRALLADPEGR